MSEVICTFYNADTKTTGYLLVEKNVTLSQFRDHITGTFGSEDFSIFDRNGSLIETNEQLKDLYAGNFQVIIANSKNEGNADHQSIEVVEPKPELISASNEVIVEPEVAEPELEPEAPKGNSEENVEETFVVGDTIKSILQRFNITINDEDSPLDIIKKLPQPMKKMAKQRVCMLKKNPEQVEQTVNTLATVFGVSPESLLIDVNDCLDHLNKKKNKKIAKSLKKESKKVEKSSERKLRTCDSDHVVKEEAEVKPTIHHAFCDRCNNRQLISGIRYKCLQCPDYDLCESCEATNATEHFHDSSHVFVKLYKPQRFFPGQLQSRRFSRVHRVNAHGNNTTHNAQCDQSGTKWPRLTKLEETVAQLQQQLNALQ